MDLKKNNFIEVIEKYDAKIYNLLLSLCRNVENAKDLTQETFINAYKSFKYFRHESNIYTWLHRIAINVWKNKNKYNARHKHGQTIPIHPTGFGEGSIEIPVNEEIFEKLEKNQLIQIINSQLKKLPSKYRLALTLYIRNSSYREISKILKCSIGQAKSLVFRAKILLRDRIFK